MDKESCKVRVSILTIWKDWIDNGEFYGGIEGKEERLSQISKDISEILSKKDVDKSSKKNEFCMDCKYWDGEGDGGVSWSINGCGYCLHGPPTAGCRNQESDFPITSEYGWCWQWHKIDDDNRKGGI